jgi:hypothetical protein
MLGAIHDYNAGPRGTEVALAAGNIGGLDSNTANYNYVANVDSIAVNCF